MFEVNFRLKLFLLSVQSSPLFGNVGSTSVRVLAIYAPVGTILGSSPLFFPFEVYFLTGPIWRDLLLSTRAPACLLENIPKRRLNGMVDEFLHIRTRPSLLVRALLKLSRIRGRSIKSGGNVSIPLVLEEKSKGLSGKGKIGRAERLNSQLIQMIEVSFFSLITLSPQIPPTYFRMRLVRRIVGNHQVLAGI